MSASPPVRRSGRATRPNKRYTNDLFEKYNINVNASSDEEEAPAIVYDAEDATDEEFDAEKAAENDELADDAADSEDHEDADSDVEEVRKLVAKQDSLDDDFRIVEATDGGGVKNDPVREYQPRKRQPVSVQAKLRVARTNVNHLPIFDPLGTTGSKGRMVMYTRGIPDILHHQSRDSRILYMMGPGKEDLIGYMQTRDRWHNDETAPYRRRYVNGRGGLGYSPYYVKEKRERELAEGLAWFRELSMTMSAIGNVNIDERLDHSDSIVAGPVDNPQLIPGVEPYGTWNLRSVFKGPQAAVDQQAHIINAGSRIQCLDWLPNMEGTHQTLAVAPAGNHELAEGDEALKAPAYTPQPRRSQCLQFWSMPAEGDIGDVGSRMRSHRPAKLTHVYSSDWGAIKKMKFCPILSKEPHALLAAIFADGKVRVLDFKLPLDANSETKELHITKTVFESSPPNTLCTCVTWLSDTSLAIGTSNGSVAIWSLPTALSENDSDPRPWFYMVIHQSYIQSIASGYPSRPNMLFTHSLDGLTRVTDLRAPTTDTATTSRSRISQGPLVWHEATQSAISVDDNFTARCFALRVFHKATSVARFTALAADLSTSLIHTSLLVGCVDGSVWVTAPLRRVRDHKMRPLVQCVLKHDWRRPITTSADIAPPDPPETASQQDILSKPLIRLSTGYKVQHSDMGQENRVNSTKDYTSFATVYEEKAAVTQVCWNPNLRAGTWAAVGMASGLVVVKDLGAD